MIKKVTIIATDNIGRKKSITLHLPNQMAEILTEKTANDGYDDPDNYPETRIANLLNSYRNQGTPLPKGTQLSKHQYYRLLGFLSVINNIFYNYTLSVATNG